MNAEERLVMQEVADEAAKRAVREVLTTLGVDHARPLEAQRDFAALREFRLLTENDEYLKDQLHLRKWRKAMDSVESKGFVATLSFVILALVALVAADIGIKFN